MCCLIYKFLLILTQKMQISFLKILPENALKFVSKKMRICVKNFAQLQQQMEKSAGVDESKEQAFTGNTGAFLTGTAHVMENRKSDGEKVCKTGGFRESGRSQFSIFHR